MHYEYKLSGVSFGSRQQTIRSLKEGDSVEFHRERFNLFDKNAILVTSNYGKDIGYVPREKNSALATRMDHLKANKLLGKVKKVIGGLSNQFFGIIVVLEFNNEVPSNNELNLTAKITEHKTFYYKAGLLNGKMNFDGILRHVERIESHQSPLELINSFIDIISEIKTFFIYELVPMQEDDTYYIKGLRLASNLSYQVAQKLFLINLSVQDIKITEECEQYIFDSFFLLPNDSIEWIELLEGLYLNNCLFSQVTPTINFNNLNNSYSHCISSSYLYITN